MSKKTGPDTKRAEQQAIEWLVRSTSGEFTDADQASLDAWLKESPENAAAYERALETWDLMGAAVIVDEKTPQAAPAKPPAPQSAVSRRSWWPKLSLPIPAWGLAAATVMVAVLGIWFFTDFLREGPAPQDDRLVADAGAETQTYQALVGEVKTVSLADGSTITLNTATRVQVTLTPEDRQVMLMEGEAFFHVSHNPDRPFTVTAGNVVTTVLGTEFTVESGLNNVEIRVTTGSVKVDSQQTGQVVLGSSEKVAWTRAEGIGTVQAFNPEDENAWTRGELVVRDEPLGNVVAKVSKYLTTDYIIEDNELAATQVTASFSLDNPQAIIELLKAQYGLEEVTSGSRIVLVKKD